LSPNVGSENIMVIARFPKIKKGLLEFADYSGRPTFSDLLGPVYVYRADRFTGNI